MSLPFTTDNVLDCSCWRINTNERLQDWAKGPCYEAPLGTLHYTNRCQVPVRLFYLQQGMWTATNTFMVQPNQTISMTVLPRGQYQARAYNGSVVEEFSIAS
jgi:hypothetical protein